MFDAWPQARTAQLRALVLEDLTAEQIGARMGLSKSAIIGKCNRLGISLRNARGSLKARRAAAFGAQCHGQPVAAPRACQYIHGDPAEPGWAYCGAPVVPGRSYCEHHLHRCYTNIAQPAATGEGAAP